MNLLVLDVGTSSIRGILYDQEGTQQFCHQINYQVRFVGSGWAEQDPRDWSDTLVEIGRATADYARAHGCSVDGVVLTSQRSSIIPVDREGTPLRPAIMWQDRRNSGIVAQLADQVEFVHSLTGARINTVFSGTKMTWFRREEGDCYRKTHKICTIADYIIHQLTGRFVTDHTYGARSLLMNIRTRQWDDRLLELFEVEREKLCDLAEPGSVVGTLQPEFARQTGLPAGIPVVSGGGDQQCAALGHGVTRAGRVELTTGTGAFILGCADQVPEDLKSNVICGAHAVPGKYVLESSMLACAATYNWVKDLLFHDSAGYEAINAAVAAAPAGSHGCLVLPYFQGRGTPDWNSKATGGFVQLSLGTTQGDMARAVLEGIAYEAGHNLQILEGYLGRVEQVYIGGGLTKFDTFNQIQADVYGHTLVRNVDSGEQTALGAWANGAVALGAYATHDAAIEKATARNQFETYQPDETRRAVYQAAQQRMLELYEQMQ